MAASSPSWIEERRKAALEAFEAEPVPTWRRSGFWTTTLRNLDFDALEPRRYEPVSGPVMDLVRTLLARRDLAQVAVEKAGFRLDLRRNRRHDQAAA